MASLDLDLKPIPAKKLSNALKAVAEKAAAAEKRSKRAKARADAAAAGNELHVQMFDVAEELGGKLSNLRLTGDETRFEAKDLTFGLSEHAADGVERCLCIDPDAVHSGMMRGLQGILDEVASNGTETDKECLHYVLHEEAGSNGTTFQL